MTPTRGFNADQRAKERESGPVVIGEVTYHPARLTNKRMRQVRRMSRQAGQEARRLAQATDLYKETLQRELDTGTEEKEAKVIAEDVAMADDSVAEVVNESVADQLSILLVDDNQQPPTREKLLEHLDDDLDQRDVNALMGYLLGAEDPSQPETTS